MSVPSGFRKMTPGINRATQFAAQWDTRIAAPKKHVVLAFNKVAKLLGVSAQGREIINILFSFTRDCDWNEGSRPIVWPDNRRLTEQTGLSVSALKRHIRLLAERGLIAFKDSPNGRRIGRRYSDTGKIDTDRSYGFDLAPLGVRAREFEDIHVAETHRTQQSRALANEFTCQRKMLSSILSAAQEQAFPGPWDEFHRELKLLELSRRERCDTAKLVTLCDHIKLLLERAQSAYSTASNVVANQPTSTPETLHEGENLSTDQRLPPNGSKNGPPIQNTNEDKNLVSYCGDDSTIHEKQPNPSHVPCPQNRISSCCDQDHAITIDIIRLNCPNFWQWVYRHEGCAEWNDVITTAASTICNVLGISQKCWASAAHILGRRRAAVAVALIFEKHTAGTIVSPAAYLKGMVLKAQRGSLRLSASIFYRSVRVLINSQRASSASIFNYAWKEGAAPSPQQVQSGHPPSFPHSTFGAGHPGRGFS